RDPDAATRAASARALLLRRGSEARSLVDPLLADSSIYVRVGVLDAFRELPASSEVGTLLAERLDPGRPQFERMTAAEVLGARRDPGAAERLRAGLADSSMLFVASCASGLASAGDTASARLLARTYAARGVDAEREAPQTVRNFVRLARTGYFNGLAVHRVVPNFVIQDGDPTGTGSGGPGYTIRCEYNRLHYDPGMVGMALSGKDTGGSQWFITHS